MKIEFNPFEVPTQSLRTVAHFFNCLAADREGKPLDYAGAGTKVGTLSYEVVLDTTKAEGAIARLADSIPPPPPLAANPGNVPDAPGASTQSQTSTTGALAPQGFNGAELDANGLPWDARIHSSSKNKNADQTWRYVRVANAADKPAFEQLKQQVEAELRAQMADLPADAAANIPPPPPPVTQQSDVPPPPPPVPAPAPDAPPAGQVTMQEVFSRANKTPVEQRNQALELVGLASMTEFLKGVKTRPELADELNAALAAVSGDE